MSFSSETKYFFSKTKDSLLLRSLLRKDPSWLRGHRLLAKFEIDKQLKATEKREFRSLGTIEASAKALAVLGEDEGRVSYLQGMYHFFSSNYAHALNSLQLALSSDELSRTSRPTACEFAAASAMMVGDSDLALKLFQSIDVKDRNPEVMAAIEMLESEEPQAEKI